MDEVAGFVIEADIGCCSRMGSVFHDERVSDVAELDCCLFVEDLNAVDGCCFLSRQIGRADVRFADGWYIHPIDVLAAVGIAADGCLIVVCRVGKSLRPRIVGSREANISAALRKLERGMQLTTPPTPSHQTTRWPLAGRI